jgi:predicted NAD/FAD-dependent oxidoreductase
MGHFQYLVAAWSACHEWPYAIIQDVELHKILLMLDSTLAIHSCQTVACDISNMYECSQIVIANHLQSI